MEKYKVICLYDDNKNTGEVIGFINSDLSKDERYEAINKATWLYYCNTVSYEEDSDKREELFRQFLSGESVLTSVNDFPILLPSYVKEINQEAIDMMVYAVIVKYKDTVNCYGLYAREYDAINAVITTRSQIDKKRMQSVTTGH